MKTTIEVMEEILHQHLEGKQTQDSINSTTFFNLDATDIQKCMRDYAREAIRELITYGSEMKILKSWVIGDNHGTSTDEENLQEFIKSLE